MLPDKKGFWIRISLLNLSIVALLGFLLRSKILFPISWINYRFLINTHSHYAFASWVTLSFLTLFTYTILSPTQQQRKWYQYMLGGITLSSLGMLISFPFQGHDTISITFSSLFIFCTYGYAWRFIKAIRLKDHQTPQLTLALCAVICLVISSVGPFILGYIIASGSTNNILHRDALYFYLHFQYNGFFTLAVFALFFTKMYPRQEQPVPKPVRRFSYLLCASVIPSFFLSLLWHPNNGVLMAIAVIGILLIIASLFYFFQIGPILPLKAIFQSSLTRTLFLLVLLSFLIKSFLQMGTIIPDLGNAVFGFRPIIIGFLHLIFLGMASFYILSAYTVMGILQTQNAFTRFAIGSFITAVIVQETVLLIQGIGLLTGHTNPVYNWLLWGISIVLALSAMLISIAGFNRPSKAS
ncbi:hypothetical protein [Flavisolibacter tropicus]|uniref:Cytochrome oxidase subunit I profile domain-containing protein n=1 Tax=Flavisolibacter tropicus TaxID=1492898 RepID=A0A172TV22_9BACT|nr:hypothetical protein [Flavisolibacter tropicus]ANE50890.1 hypothetical protein SY85_10620 [Flavisolibacter tropicus]